MFSENFVKVLNFDKVVHKVCHSEERGIALETRQSLEILFSNIACGFNRRKQIVDVPILRSNG